jgi:hypothetical protein
MTKTLAPAHHEIYASLYIPSLCNVSGQKLGDLFCCHILSSGIMHYHRFSIHQVECAYDYVSPGTFLRRGCRISRKHTSRKQRIGKAQITAIAHPYSMVTLAGTMASVALQTQRLIPSPRSAIVCAEEKKMPSYHAEIVSARQLHFCNPTKDSQ